MPGEKWTWQRALQALEIIVVAVVLGNLIDHLFARFARYRHPLFPILLQFLAIIAIVAALETITNKFFPNPITNNIFFISVFLGVQQNLWARTTQLGFLRPKSLA